MFSLFEPQTWRYERKFVIQEMSRQEVESIVLLHPAMFRKIYHERQVNNIYFDTFGMSNYLHNVVGNSQRAKVRIRWYGDMFGHVGKPVLEIKLKSGYLGSKISFPLEPFDMNESLSIGEMRELFRRSEHVPEAVRENLITLDFALLNAYMRNYYLSGDNDFRVTIDTALQYRPITPRMNRFIEMYQDHFTTILELKYARENDDRALTITKRFPFRVTKSSKYINGIDRITL